MYHLPNIIIYSFGVVGLRQLIRKIHKNNWKDKVLAAQATLSTQIENGTARLKFDPGFSLLFVGDGDQVGKSLVRDNPLLGVTLSAQRQPYTDLWGKYVNADGGEGFQTIMAQINAQDAGEYVLFPVVDNHLFLPGQQDYDAPPHRIEIAVQRIRDFEAEQGWTPKKIVIVGDQEQTSRFVTTRPEGALSAQEDLVSLKSIAREYDNVVVADPTNITLLRIIDIAQGRRIHFHASEQGTARYAEAFFHRLSLLGYTATREGTLTVGYDITDQETEHQIVSCKRDQYLPVILSRDVFDLLSKSYLEYGKYIFVPQLVKEELHRIVRG